MIINRILYFFYSFYISIFVLLNNLKLKNMGRHPLPKEKKRVLIGASIEQQIVDNLGLLNCKEIAENAVIKEYLKLKKNAK
jgi:hypothetical protein